MNNPCPLCVAEHENILWQDAACRVTLVHDLDYPGFCRVIWNNHVSEMTDLSGADRVHFMRAVFAVEAVLREILQPAKINLASLGNQTPHLHWHVIPRYTHDACYPNSIWSQRLRDTLTGQTLDVELLKDELVRRLT